jgi:oligosaccharide repeat unit polymerase
LNQYSFTPEEFIPFSGLLILIGFIVVSNYLSDYRAFWSPLTIIAIIFAYYCLLGPFQAVSTGETYDRFVNMRKFYVSAFWGALVFLVSLLVGYKTHTKKGKVLKIPSEFIIPFLDSYGKKLFITGFILFTIWTGGRVANLLNPLDAEPVNHTGGAISNYLGLSLNFLIPATALLFSYYINNKKGFWVFVICFIISLGLSLSLGFRYRIILLFGSIGIIYYLSIGKRPNLGTLVAVVFALITFMGIINITRQYGSGLRVSKLAKSDTQEYYESGLKEALIFQTSGAVIDLVPEKHSYAGISPIVATILFPIPSAIYKEKQSGKYFFDMLDAIYGKRYRQGAFFMSYAEFYLAFGWFGIIAGGFLTGFFSRKLWNWYLANHRSPLAIVIYSVTVTYLYVVLSRGYLPQVTMLFFFSVFPVYVVKWLIKKRFKRLSIGRKVYHNVYPHAIPPDPHRQQP